MGNHRLWPGRYVKRSGHILRNLLASRGQAAASSCCLGLLASADTVVAVESVAWRPCWVISIWLVPVRPRKLGCTEDEADGGASSVG